MKILCYWETLRNGLASCKHGQNRSMSVGSRKAVSVVWALTPTFLRLLTMRTMGSSSIKALAYCGAEPQALKKLEKCEKVVDKGRKM